MEWMVLGRGNAVFLRVEMEAMGILGGLNDHLSLVYGYY